MQLVGSEVKVTWSTHSICFTVYSQLVRERNCSTSVMEKNKNFHLPEIQHFASVHLALGLGSLSIRQMSLIFYTTCSIDFYDILSNYRINSQLSINGSL